MIICMMQWIWTTQSKTVEVGIMSGHEMGLPTDEEENLEAVSDQYCLHPPSCTNIPGRNSAVDIPPSKTADDRTRDEFQPDEDHVGRPASFSFPLVKRLVAAADNSKARQSYAEAPYDAHHDQVVAGGPCVMIPLRNEGARHVEGACVEGSRVVVSCAARGGDDCSGGEFDFSRKLLQQSVVCYDIMVRIAFARAYFMLAVTYLASYLVVLLTTLGHDKSWGQPLGYVQVPEPARQSTG